MKGLNVGGSYTFGGAPTGLGEVDKDYVNWNLFEIHGQYDANNIIGAFEYGSVNFSHEADNGLDLVLPEQVATGYYLQLGYNVADMMGWEDCKLAPWFGMGMYDLNDLVDGDVSNTMLGLTWWPTDQISWKMDYDMQVTTNSEGEETKANVLSLGVGYMF